jgi:hypothetical protein
MIPTSHAVALTYRLCINFTKLRLDASVWIDAFDTLKYTVFQRRPQRFSLFIASQGGQRSATADTQGIIARAFARQALSGNS